MISSRLLRCKRKVSPTGVSQKRLLSSDHSTPPTSNTPPKIHKEEYIEIARNWPHEYHYPGHYMTGQEDENIYPSKSFHTDGSDSLKPEQFGLKFFKTLAVFGGVAGLYLAMVNRYQNEHQIHPITKFLDEQLPGAGFLTEQDKELNRKWLKVRAAEADDRIIVRDRDDLEPVIHRFRNTDMFHRCSDALIEPGTQIVFEDDFKMITTWNENDKYMPKVKKELEKK